MRNLMNRILNVFKRKDGKDFQFNDIRRVCKSASKELGDQCKIESVHNRTRGSY